MIVGASSPFLTRLLLIGALVALTACAADAEAPAESLEELGARYAAAWSSQDPDRFAAFYAEDGSLIVNGAPSAGRAAIRATAASYMAAFPDMRVVMDSIVGDEDRRNRAVFHWTWTGTNTGPGGTGRPVHLSGYEEWTLNAEGLIAESNGQFDEAEYERQMSAEGG